MGEKEAKTKEAVFRSAYTIMQDMDSTHRELIQVLDKIYFSILKVDIENDSVCMLQSMGHPEAIGGILGWNQYLKMTSGLFVPDDRGKVWVNFCRDSLLQKYEAGDAFFEMDALYIREGELKGMKMSALFQNDNGVAVAYVSVRNSSMECLRSHILNEYIYENCDYFCYLDSKNNSYTMFERAENGAPHPPVKSKNYEADMAAYGEEVVEASEREAVIRAMKLENVCAQLENKEVYTVYCGIMDPVRGYTRKKLEFRYYERSTGMILFSRTDITDVYLEEKKRQEELTAALRKAQTDSLSGLLNYQGMAENVSKLLESSVKHGALLFVDLDNFKAVNDTLGHLMGDHVLRKVSGILCEEAKQGQLIGRVGGDEFIIFFPYINSMEEVTAYAECIGKEIASVSCKDEENEVRISCSIGIVETPADGDDYKTLVKKADEMTYYAKANGKNQYAVYGRV